MADPPPHEHDEDDTQNSLGAAGVDEIGPYVMETTVIKCSCGHIHFSSSIKKR